MIAEQVIHRAAEVLFSAAPAGSQVIRSGSHARDEADGSSDADFVVIEPESSDRRAETTRLRRHLRPLRITVDLLVVSRRAFDTSRDAPDNVIYQAAREGRCYGRYTRGYSPTPLGGSNRPF
jgi:predicted nucleotidyltransferase